MPSTWMAAGLRLFGRTAAPAAAPAKGMSANWPTRFWCSASLGRGRRPHGRVPTAEVERAPHAYFPTPFAADSVQLASDALENGTPWPKSRAWRGNFSDDAVYGNRA